MNKLETYAINPQTMAILPAKQVEYDTSVLETNKHLHVRETPLKLIKNACFNNWTTYEGRREAVIHHTNFTRKVPIPISRADNIYFFPTHAPKSIDNHWIAYGHISRIEPSPTNKNTQTIIYFKNGQAIEVDASIYIIRKQMERTFVCMYEMGSAGERVVRSS